MKKIIIYIFATGLLFSCQKKDSLAKLPPELKEKQVSPPTTPSIQQIKTPPANPLTQQIKASPADDAVDINTLTATVIGVQTSQLSFRISGYVSSVLVKNGQYIKKGQVIARLDNSIALQNLNLAKYDLEKANTAQHFAELTLQRTRTLNQRQATTQIALEQAESGFLNAQIACKQADANLRLSQINFDETNLIAPFDGYLLNISTWIGNYVSSTTAIATLTSTNDLQIQIPVPQTITNNFSIGQEFSFSNSSQNIAGTLKITGIVPYVDASSKTYLLYASPIKIRGQLMAGELVVVNLK
ncbi:MAG: efflux RND transporter periplasmic adaptor subunit [Bdellovibrionota bacterium]